MNYNINTARASRTGAPMRYRKGGMPTRHKAIFAVILILYTAILSTVTYFILYKPSSGPSKKIVEYSTDDQGNVVKNVQEYTPIEGNYNILLLGLDKVSMSTDVVMLINMNNNDNKITVMQIPRDTYIRALDETRSVTNKMNENFVDHYNYRRSSGDDEDTAFMNALHDVETIFEDSLCININYSAIMDLEGFRNIVDTIGGVEIDIPQNMQYEDPGQDLYIDFKAGMQTLNGEDAEKFVRFRDTYAQADLGRVNAQKMFLVALFNKVKSSISLTNLSMLNSLADSVFSSVTTDLAVSDIVYFGRSVLSCDLEGITMLTLPGNLGGSDHYVMNRAAANNVINQYFNTYDRDIASGAFDSKGNFNNPSISYINEVYYSAENKLYDKNIYNGSEVDKSKIDIPLIKKKSN